MGKLSREQEEMLSQIDAMLVMIDRYGSLAGLFDNFKVNLSPFGLLMSLLKRFGIGYDEIVEWLSNYIVEATPLIEIAVKGVLLAKLKSNVDCNLDPRIPQNYREKIGGCVTTPFFSELDATGDDSNVERGIEIDLSSIDYYGLLNNSPISDKSHYNYFGTNVYYYIDNILGKKYYTYQEAVEACKLSGISEESIVKKSQIDSIYELVRAKDMNAFLWFVLHKAKFLNTNNLSDYSDGNILKCITGVTDTPFAVGQTFYQMSGSNKSGVVGMCIKNKPIYNQSIETKENSTPHLNLNGNTDLDVALPIQKFKSKFIGYSYEIIPTTNIWNGVNWYVDRSRYMDFWDKKERDYAKEFALFRLAMKTIDGRNTNKLVFTIKPSPNVIVPKIKIDPKIEKVEDKNKLSIEYTGDNPFNFFTLRFNCDGKKDNSGKYSVVCGGEIKDDKDYRIFKVKNPVTNEDSDITLYVNKKTIDYWLEGEDITTVLYECYPGLTVYEFNYDFIMGMKLFDPMVITAKLIEGLTNIRLGINVNKTTTDYKVRISEIVKKMVETNGYQSSDCFYTFSNDEYDSMVEKSEMKRSELYPFQSEYNNASRVSEKDVYGILNEYDSNATLEENISIVKRAITQASATISEEVLPQDKYSIELDFITKAIEMITSIFVEAMLSPKLLMIMAVNNKIMGGDNSKGGSLEYLLKAFESIIISMINEIVEIVLQRLLKFVGVKIDELFGDIGEILVMEQIEFYTRLISQMLKACAFRIPSNPNLSSTLDNVDYADIDPNDTPVTNEC